MIHYASLSIHLLPRDVDPKSFNDFDISFEDFEKLYENEKRLFDVKAIYIFGSRVTGYWTPQS
ncbi:unnamed protein product, partial [marine sediment metagenome]